jgi:glycosyltransferase involved in cell wall biosynthesis
MDIAYQLLMKGVIPNSNSKKSELQNIEIDCVDDNYVFVKRHFGWAKSLYVLIIRLMSFNNPVLEIIGYVKALKVLRVDVYSDVINTSGFESFESELLKQNPLVSIVIPTLNRYDYLKDVLSDLEKQDYKNFEVIVCDQSEPLRETFFEDWNLDIKLIVQEEKALWLARNRCIKMAKGEYILLFDDDSRVESNWVSSHLKCLDYFQVSISAGVTNTLVGHGLSAKEGYFHLSDVFDTGNALVEKKVFEKIGLFDRQFEKQRMGDGEFGLRAYLGGFQVISNPYATRIHLKVETGGLRQMGSWDGLRPKKLLAPRPVPSVLYLIRKYFGTENAILYLLQNIPFSFIPYKFKKSKVLKMCSVLFLPLLLPLMLFVSLKSWRAASRKLKEGSRIELLLCK